MKLYNETIVCIDIGEKYNGLVIYDMYNVTPHWVVSDEHNSLSAVNEIDKIITPYKFKKITFVVEDFVKYGHKPQLLNYKNNITSELLGAIKLYCSMNNIDLVLQKAVQAKIFKDDRLIKLNFLIKNKNNYQINTPYGVWNVNRHIRDAFRHLIYYTNKNIFNGCISYNKLYNIK